MTKAGAQVFTLTVHDVYWSQIPDEIYVFDSEKKAAAAMTSHIEHWLSAPMTGVAYRHSEEAAGAFYRKALALIAAGDLTGASDMFDGLGDGDDYGDCPVENTLTLSATKVL